MESVEKHSKHANLPYQSQLVPGCVLSVSVDYEQCAVHGVQLAQPGAHCSPPLPSLGIRGRLTAHQFFSAADRMFGHQPRHWLALALQTDGRSTANGKLQMQLAASQRDAG